MSTPTFAGETGSHTVEEVATRHPGLVTVGRVGWVAKGVVYALVGALAIPIALQDGPQARSSEEQQEQASQLGAVSKIADTTLGVPLLYAIAIGLLLYAAWRLVTIALPAENSAKAWATRVGYSVSAVIYAALGWTAISFARRGSSSSRNDAVTPLTTKKRETAMMTTPTTPTSQRPAECSMTSRVNRSTLLSSVGAPELEPRRANEIAVHPSAA